MSWLDWKLRDVVAIGGGVGIFLATFVAGGILSNLILEAFGAPPPEDFEGTLFGTMAAGLGGIALGYIFATQLGAGRRVRGLFSATVIVVFAVAGMSVVQAAANLIENELLSLMASLILTVVLFVVLAGAGLFWARRNPWVMDRLSGRGRD